MTKMAAKWLKSIPNLWPKRLKNHTLWGPLLRTDFSESESERFSGIVTTVFRFSGDEWLAIWGPISWSGFCALISFKWLKSFELVSWMARIDCAKTAGQILESSEGQCRICFVRWLRFWHIALIVILIMLREKEFCAHWIWRRYWLVKEDAWRRTSCIYFLPKIHKPNNSGRPIVSACSWPTELISSYL